MKYIPKLLLETSVFNYYNYGKEGRKQQDTRQLFADIRAGKYLAYMSSEVMDEIMDAQEENRDKMLELADTYKIDVVQDNPLVDPLADLYVARNIIPAKYRMDAVHIATATVNDLDCVVSFDMEHIVKPKTLIGAGFINLYEGYRWIGLATPTEVIEYVNA
jgi:predicted nucleic acid-binding protein